MATLGRETYKREDGSTSTYYRVLFVDPAGKRQTIRLGKVPKKVAESAKLKIEALLAARIAGHTLDAQTAGWLGEIGESIHERLAKVGLVEPRERAAAVAWTLGSFLEHYFGTLGQQKRMTALNYGRARRLFLGLFVPGARDHLGEQLVGIGGRQGRRGRLRWLLRLGVVCHGLSLALSLRRITLARLAAAARAPSIAALAPALARARLARVVAGGRRRPFGGVSRLARAFCSAIGRCAGALLFSGIGMHRDQPRQTA